MFKTNTLQVKGENVMRITIEKENVMDFNFIKEIKSQTKFLDNIDQFIGMLDIMKLMKKDDRD